MDKPAIPTQSPTTFQCHHLISLRKASSALLCLLLLFTLNANAALVTYRFSGTIDNTFFPSEGTLTFGDGIEAFTDWTYDPDTWFVPGGTTNIWNGQATVEVNIGGFSTETSGLSGANYNQSYLSAIPSINLQARNDPDIQGDGRVLGGGPYYIFDIKLFDPTGFHNEHGEPLDTLSTNVNGVPPSVTLIEIDYFHEVIGRTVWEIDSITIVPTPPAVLLFVSALSTLAWQRSTEKLQALIRLIT